MVNLDTQIMKIKHSNICQMLKQKFDVERMDRFFRINNDFTFSCNDFTLNHENSIYLSFNSIKNEHSYNLLLIFALSDENVFPHSLQNQIRRISEHNIDKLVIWLRKPIDSEILQSLKRCNANVVHITNKEISNVKYISSFYPIGTDYNYAVVLNKLTDLLIIRLKKLFHLVLSEIAAPTYDETYGSEKIGTKAIMKFEADILKSTIKSIKYKNRSLNTNLDYAVDVGCGTGRHSRNVLASHFTTVYGFDFSPKMIEMANEKKRATNQNNIIFTAADMEYEEIMYEDEYYGLTDLVVASFGMGSFIEDTARMLRRFHEWLKPGGTLFLSFYNKNSVLLNLTPNWRDTSLSAHIDIDTNTLQVQLNEDTLFQIFCKPFDNSIKSEITKKFDVDQIYSYPTTLALLPNSLLQDNLAENLFTKIDKTLSTDTETFLGHYVIIVAHKQASEDLDGYKNVVSILESKAIKYEILDHEAVLSIKDVITELKIDKGVLIKSLVFYRPHEKSYILIVLPHNKRINKTKLADQLQVIPKKVRFATEKEIVHLGFQLGGVPPFGYPGHLKVECYIHPDLLGKNELPFYMGIGDNRKTLKLSSHSFQEIVKAYTVLDQQ
ncbi:methyltransferase domain-containing protein [Candidatus Peregrinibacteria bacterium]|nr:methyltransferase domain-containing protein [Candidatus Peregrinibacteria bacterium]